MTYGYFPGCSLLSSAVEYASSAESVLKALGVELQEIDDWVCCGATPAHATSHLLSLSLPAITITAAEKQGLTDIITCCAACYSRLKQANHELISDSTLMAQVNEVIEEDYKGTMNIKHITEVLARDIGLDAIAAATTKPLSGLKVACYYGCLIARMPEELRIDSAEYPQLMDDLIRAVGAEPVEWPYKTECCGAALTLARPDTVVRLSGDILQIAKEHGADVLAVVCPLCQANLDMFQSDAELRTGGQLGVPALYFTQLMGLAMGVELEKLYFNNLIVDPQPVLAGKGLIPGEVFL